MNSIFSANCETYIINCLCQGPNCQIIIKQSQHFLSIVYDMFYDHSTYNKPKIFNILRRLFSWFSLGQEIEFFHNNMTFLKNEIKLLEQFDSNIKVAKYFDDQEDDETASYIIEYKHKIKKKELDFSHFLTYVFHGYISIKLIKYVSDGDTCYYIE